MVINFGKHKDEEIADIPTDYLKWVLAEVKNISDALYDAIDKELEERHEA